MGVLDHENIFTRKMKTQKFCSTKISRSTVTSLFCCITLICYSLLFLIQTDCAGLGLMLYQSFPHLLNAHFVTQHQLLLSHLVENSCKKPQTVSLYHTYCGRLALFPGSSAPEREIEFMYVERAWYFFSRENPQR